MRQQKLLKLLLTPSFFSGSVVFLVSAGLLGYSGWLYTNNNQLFYDFLFGPYGIKTVIWQDSLALNNWRQVFFASPITYYVVLLGVAITMGLTVFTILQAAGVVYRGSSELMHEALGGGVVARRTNRDLFYRLAMRVVSLIGWSFYISYFVSVLVPLIYNLNETGIARLQRADYGGATLILGAFFFFMLALHVHIICMRLFMLRPRVFGGDMDILEAETHTSKE